ncbi:hypothetical protein N0V93_002446 [Gnomoniopsis smithogilvyi]|uniref:Uncharacterized protein n=1 Tax=Gnomoniopsis smithogilvyi TaxID=1191159 RepID=A0A9W9CZ31_9PEZI|nr:hypothetical protein N0V93_002446 [Gnomoniopsis smithogilvyi]
MFGPAFISILSLLAVANGMPSTYSDFSTKETRDTNVTTPDIDAIMAVPTTAFTSYADGGLVRAPIVDESALRKRCSTSPILTWGDEDDGGLGVTVTNADSDWRGFYIYENSLLATWFEITIDQYNVMWADVSLIRGCDGAALIWSLDNSGGWKGFTQWILDGAPEGAYDMKTDGQWVLKYTENGDGSINTIPRDWEVAEVGADYVYVDDAHVGPVISSQNGRMGSYWPAGRV